MNAKSLASILISLGAAAYAHGQISYATAGAVYNESFDGLPTTTTASFFSSTVGVQTALTGASGWVGTKNAGTGTSGTSFFAAGSTSTTNSGGVYSYGDDADRALGLLASGTNIMSIGTSFTNDTGSTLTEVTISFTTEVWRSSTTTQNVLTFAYGLSGGTATATNFLTDTSLTSLAALNVVGQTPVTTNGGQNGNLNQTAVSAVITGLNWTPGSTLFIRWSDLNDAGNDAGLAIDNFGMTAVIPEPSTYAAIAGVLGLGAAVIARRRRS